MKRFAATVLGGLVLLVLPACGSKTDETVRAAGITPPNALGFLSVNLSPSIEQKRSLLSIARRFPDARDQVKEEFDTTVDDLLADILEDSGLDYAADVKPWLGNEVAIAFLPPGDGDEPLFIAMIQTEDEAKAKAAIEKAKTSEFEGAYAIVEDFVVISDQSEPEDNQPALDLVVAQGGKDDGGLAEANEFTSVVDELAGDRLLLGWLDVKDSVGLAGELGDDDLEFLQQFADDAKSVAFDVHADSAAMVFQAVAAATGEDSSGKPELTASLPANTLAALTLFNLDSMVSRGLEAIVGTGEEVTAEFEQMTGLNLDEDILSWMQGEVAFVAGPVRDDQPFPDFAIVVEPTDQAKAEAAVTRIKDALAEQGFELAEREIGGATAFLVPEEFIGGIQPAMALFPDRFVLANSPAYLGDLAKAATPGLGTTDAYESVVDEDGDRLGQFVLLIDPVREAIENAFLGEASAEDRADYDAKVRPNLEPLSAFGVTARRDGDFSKFELRLTFD